MMKKRIGYLGSDGVNCVCDDGALVVVGGRGRLKRMIQKNPLYSDMDVYPALSDHIIRCLWMGAAYSFDKSAYKAFLPLARRAGLPLGDVEFPDKNADGTQTLLRVQLVSGQEMFGVA